jgi:hypothetical protein
MGVSGDCRNLGVTLSQNDSSSHFIVEATMGVMRHVHFGEKMSTEFDLATIGGTMDWFSRDVEASIFA